MRAQRPLGDAMNRRSVVLKRQGYRDSAFAVVTAGLALVANTPAIALVGCAIALWLVLRGRLLVQHSDPLSDIEKRELERLRSGSRAVQRALELLRAAGGEPVRLDLLRCRQLARLEDRARHV